MKIETGKEWDREEVLRALQEEFERDLEKFKRSGFAPFHDQFESLMAYKGKAVRVFDGQTTWEGVCHSVTGEGQLNLLLPDHSIRTLSTGDMSYE